MIRLPFILRFDAASKREGSSSWLTVTFPLYIILKWGLRVGTPQTKIEL